VLNHIAHAAFLCAATLTGAKAMDTAHW